MTSSAMLGALRKQASTPSWSLILEASGSRTFHRPAAAWTARRPTSTSSDCSRSRTSPLQSTNSLNGITREQVPTAQGICAFKQWYASRAGRFATTTTLLSATPIVVIPNPNAVLPPAETVETGNVFFGYLAEGLLAIPTFGSYTITIIIFTLVARTAASRLVDFWMKKRLKRLYTVVGPALIKYNEKVSKELVPEARKKGASYTEYKKMVNEAVTTYATALKKKHRCNPRFNIFIPALCHAPLLLTFSLALRRALSMPASPLAAEWAPVLGQLGETSFDAALLLGFLIFARGMGGPKLFVPAKDDKVDTSNKTSPASKPPAVQATPAPDGPARFQPPVTPVSTPQSAAASERPPRTASIGPRPQPPSSVSQTGKRFPGGTRQPLLPPAPQQKPVAPLMSPPDSPKAPSRKTSKAQAQAEPESDADAAAPLIDPILGNKTAQAAASGVLFKGLMLLSPGIAFYAMSAPSALVLYWIVSALHSYGYEFYLQRRGPTRLSKADLAPESAPSSSP